MSFLNINSSCSTSTAWGIPVAHGVNWSGGSAASTNATWHSSTDPWPLLHGLTTSTAQKHYFDFSARTRRSTRSSLATTRYAKKSTRSTRWRKVSTPATSSSLRRRNATQPKRNSSKPAVKPNSYAPTPTSTCSKPNESQARTGTAPRGATTTHTAARRDQQQTRHRGGHPFWADSHHHP